MDDAAGGKRGLRAEPSPRLFEAVRDSYGIDGADGSADLGGSSSLNLLIAHGDGRFVVRVYRPYVTAGRLTDIHAARRELAAAGVPVPEALPTRDGQPWTVLDGRLVEVERYIESDSGMDSWERLEAGLPLLGRVHSVLRRVEAGPEGRRPLFANHIEPQDVLSRTLQGVHRIRAWNPSPVERRLADAAEELAHLVSTGERDLVPALPRQLVHGDYWDNNVLFRNGSVALVTDFDFMGERARIDDIALTLYFAMARSPGGPAPDEHLRRLGRLVDAYDQGLDERLSREESAALPLAIARQPLWSIGGWIALLDSEEATRKHAAGMLPYVERALQTVRDLARWQAALA